MWKDIGSLNHLAHEHPGPPSAGVTCDFEARNQWLTDLLSDDLPMQTAGKHT